VNEHNGKSSDQIKADIERTRNEMTEKIDTIQDRLSPDNLKLQAQSMVQDILQESSDAITDFIKSSSRQAGQGLVETIKQNPLPSAVVGLGLGWLLMNTVNNQRSGSDSDDRRRRYYTGDRMDRMGYGANMNYGSEYNQGIDYGRGMGQGSMMGARVPYSGPALDDAYTGNYGYEQWQDDDQSGGLADKAGNMAGKVGRTAKDAAGKVGDTAQNIAGSVGGAVQNAAGAVGDAVQGAAGAVGSAAQNIAGRVGDTAGSMAQPATHMGQQARHQAMSAGRQVADQASSLTSQTQHQAARAGRQMQRTLEDNPVAFGAAALIAGIAIGLALPATRQERQLLGDVRDQVMDKAQNMVSSITDEAKQVVEEVKPRLEQTAQKVVEDLKASGSLSADELKRSAKEAGAEIKQSLKEAGTTVKSRVEDTTGMNLSSSQGGEQGGMQGSDSPDIVSGTIVEGDQTQPEPNVGGGYDSKFDNKS
jgi:ElaB/YqjD/DUF883 family membrane-anchored ribosome-binding protein